jgi:hypothetical protein
MAALGGATADGNVISQVCNSYWIALMFATGRRSNTSLKIWFLCLLKTSFTVTKMLKNESHPNYDANHLHPNSKINLWEQ